MKEMFLKVAIVFFTFNLAVGYSEIVVEEETVSTVNGQPVPGDSSVQTNNPSGDMSATQKPNPPIPAPGGGGSAGEPPNGGFTCTSAPTEVESSTGSCGCCGSCPSCSFLAGLYCVENGGGGYTMKECYKKDFTQQCTPFAIGPGSCNDSGTVCVSASDIDNDPTVCRKLGWFDKSDCTP